MIRRSLLVFLIATMFAGCSTVTEAGYYWGDYGPTLYKYTKSPTDETLAAHIESLQNIIAKSDEKSLRVPPGIYAELGYIENQRGNHETSNTYYENEIALYPESRLFLERFIGQKAESGEAQ
jgi:hypothetical protein